MPRKIQEFSLTEEQVQSIRFRLAEIARQKHLSTALETELQHFIKGTSGMDVVSEKIELDLDRGVLRRL